MNLTRWPDLLRTDPFDDNLRTWMRPFRVDGESATPTMRVDVHEQDDRYLVNAEIPGVKKEDLDVRIDGRLVSVSAQVRRETEEGPDERDGQRTLRSERCYGFVSRSFSLADEIEEAQAQARYENGVLQLTLPKKAASASHKLSVA